MNWEDRLEMMQLEQEKFDPNRDLPVETKFIKKHDPRTKGSSHNREKKSNSY